MDNMIRGGVSDQSAAQIQSFNIPAMRKRYEIVSAKGLSGIRMNDAAW